MRIKRISMMGTRAMRALGPVKLRRKLLGLSQQELSQQLDVAQNTLSAWEVGRNLPRGQNLYKLANALDVPPARLIHELIAWREAKRQRKAS